MPTLRLTFNHFFARKIMLVKYSTAFVIIPGGMGTMDELTEVLTLIQTKKIKPFPVIMFNSAYWKGLTGLVSKSSLAQWLYIGRRPALYAVKRRSQRSG